MGPLKVATAGGSAARLTRSPRQLLAILIAAGPTGPSTERLAEELWGDDLPTNWRASLRMAITRLRKVVGADTISHEPGHYRLNLPTEMVDTWWLQELVADSTRAVSEAELTRALAGEPFVGIDSLDLISRSAEASIAHQTEVAQRFCASAPVMSESIAATLAAYQRETAPFDERLAVAIGHGLLASGFTGRAKAHLDAAIESFRVELGVVPQDLIDLLGEVGDNHAAASHDPVASDSGHGWGVPAALEHLLTEACHGREGEIEQLLGGRSALMRGPSGAGKTRLLAEVAAAAAAEGEPVSYIGAVSVEAPYGPFLAAFSSLRKTLLDEIGPQKGAEGAVDEDGGEHHRTAEAIRWVAVVEHLEKMANGKRHWVLVDDVQAFDSASKRLVGYLARSASTQPLVFVVSGRNDHVDDEWNRLVSDLERYGLAEINIGSLALEALAKLVQSAFPTTSLQVRNNLALELNNLNAGLPAIARTLINAIDPETMTLDDRTESYDPDRWQQPAAGLEKEVLEVGVAAAVIGMTFAVGDVIELLDASEDKVSDGLQILWEKNRLVDGQQVDQLQFSHALVRDSFLRSVPRFKLLRLHKRAAELATDLHSIARHQADAVPAVDPSVASQSLLESARQYMRVGSWRDALGRLRDADQILSTELGSALDIDGLIMMARALDYSGMSGAGPRRMAFAKARESERWDQALRAALSGLPAGEKPDGDPDRIDMLRQIPFSELDQTEQFARAEALTRQYAVNGQPAKSKEWAEKSTGLARTPGQRNKARVAEWSATHHIALAANPLRDVDLASAEPGERMRMLQMQAIDSIEINQYDFGLRKHHEFMALAHELGDPVRIWQGMVFDSMVAFDQGDWSASSALASDAVAYGTRQGMPHAALCGIGQLFHEHWVRGNHAELIDFIDHKTTDFRHSSIAGASQLLVLFAAGQTAEAWKGAEPMIADAMARPRSPAIVVLSMLSEIAAEMGSRELVASIRHRLQAFADHCLVAGYGIANSGPVWRYLAKLAPDDDERLACLSKALDVADRSGALTWRVVARLDLDRCTGGGLGHREVADALAAESDLSPLLS